MLIKNKGFTLVELMMALAIVGILAAIAMPAYNGYVQRSARAAAQADLMTAASRMERVKAQNFSYGGTTAGAATTDTFSDKSPSDASAGTEKYTVSLIHLESDGTPAEAGDVVTGYEILAVSTNKFDSSKTEALKVDHLGRKCYKPLAASVSDCAIGTDGTWK